MRIPIRILGVGVAALALIGCSASGDEQPAPQTTPSGAASSPATQQTFVAEGDKLVDTDLGAEVFDGSGLRVTIETTASSVHIQLVDPSSGIDFTDYYVFDYSKQTMLNHRFVPMRQMAYDYTLDLETNTIVAIADGEGNDAIETLRQMGRFDKAQADRVQERADLENWFQERYGMTIEQAATA